MPPVAQVVEQGPAGRDRMTQGCRFKSCPAALLERRILVRGVHVCSSCIKSLTHVSYEYEGFVEARMGTGRTMTVRVLLCADCYDDLEAERDEPEKG